MISAHLSSKLSRGPLTITVNVFAKNHTFSPFLSATKPQIFVRKDNDLIFFTKIRLENDDPKKAKICLDNGKDLKMYRYDL